MIQTLDRYFAIRTQGSDVKTECVAGTTTFLAMVYIIVVNPTLLSAAGMPFAAAMTATVLVSAVTSILMGVVAKNPIALAPGMGLNAFFSYTLVLGMHIPWQTALGAVFWSGIIFVVLSLLNLRKYIIRAIPKQLRYGVAGGIGLFITLIGLRSAGFIVGSEATLVASGPLNWVSLTFLIGFVVTAILVIRKVKGALIIGIITTTLLAAPIGRWWGGDQTLLQWQGFFAWPDFQLFMAMNSLDALRLAIWPVVFSFLFTDLFDSLSTFVSVAEVANLFDADGDPRNLSKSLLVDAFGSALSGILGTSSATSYVESAAGVEEGGRTGLTALVTGLWFIPFLFISPLISLIPKIATAPALIIVGVFMMRIAHKINWDQLDDAIPAFMALVLIPLTSSLTQGIIWAMLAWTVMKLANRQMRQVPLTLLVIDVCAIIYLAVGL